jgi:short-subunit dehydrogenase
MSKDNKLGTVLVTGASMGIGEALARRFADAGHDLVLAARSTDKLKALAQELDQRHGINVVTVACDLSKDGEVARLAASLKRRKIDIDILVNNAGINDQGHFDQMPSSAQQAIIRLNIAATTEMMSCFIPSMVKRGHGRVLNVASTSAFIPVPFMATYAASKAYLLSLTESVSEELRGSGVTLSALCPGVTATPMMAEMSSKNSQFVKVIGSTVLDVTDVAEAGYTACMSAKVVTVPGRVNLMTTLSSRAMPKWMTRRVSGVMGRRAH